MNILTSVSQYESSRLWMDCLRSNSTRTAYAVHLSLFCRFHHTNPDELVTRKSGELKDMVMRYVLELKKKSKNTAGKPKKGVTSVNSINHF